jgi:WD40 repeat protein
MDRGYGTPRILTPALDRPFDELKQGLTTKILKGHTSYVFCLNYNSASDKLVSGCCDGDIKIWDATKGEFAHCVVGAQLI